MVDELDRIDGERRAGHSRTLGRRRVLGVLGGTLFGLAARIFVPTRAGAHACPAYCNCSGAHGGCNSCSGSSCSNDCSGEPSCNCQVFPGVCCWYVDRPGPQTGCYYRYTCCDWYKNDGTVCVCRGYIGYFCYSGPAQTMAA
jgi:hypothetical protein